MLCMKCSADVPQDALFCMRCGAKVEIGCTACGTIHPADANFCRKCGASLREAAPIRTATDAHNGPTGERRHLTVLFCDLVGSTEIASHLDPEEWRAVVRGYHRAAAEAIGRFGGSVAQYLGDGVLAAAQTAQARNAFSEAHESYRQSLRLINLLPESLERDRRELELSQALILVLSVTRGDAAPERIEATERATALAEKSNSLKQLANFRCKSSAYFFAVS